MRLRNEVRVAAPLERTWRTLLDVPRVARALPGAAIEPEPVDGAWRGTMKVRLGPVVTEYAGTARLADVDEDERAAGYHVQGREVRGQATASATITGRVLDAGEGTRLVVETDLRVTSREAQLGRGVLEDVAAAILADFAGRLDEDGLDGSGSEGGADEALGRAAPGDDRGEILDRAVATREATDALDVDRAAWRPMLQRAGFVLAGVAAGLALGRVVWRR